MFKNLIFFVFFSLGFNAQIKKPFTPTKGEVIFVEKNIITDEKTFSESRKNVIKNMIKELGKSFEGEGYDSTKIKQTFEIQEPAMEALMKEEYSNSKDSISHHHIYFKNKIESHVKNLWRSSR